VNAPRIKAGRYLKNHCNLQIRSGQSIMSVNPFHQTDRQTVMSATGSVSLHHTRPQPSLQPANHPSIHPTYSRAATPSTHTHCCRREAGGREKDRRRIESTKQQQQPGQATKQAGRHTQCSAGTGVCEHGKGERATCVCVCMLQVWCVVRESAHG